jgi:hypothetical protein
MLHFLKFAQKTLQLQMAMFYNPQCAASNVLFLWHPFKILLQHVYSSLHGQYGHFWHNRRNTLVPVKHVNNGNLRQNIIQGVQGDNEVNKNSGVMHTK